MFAKNKNTKYKNNYHNKSIIRGINLTIDNSFLLKFVLESSLQNKGGLGKFTMVSQPIRLILVDCFF